MEATLVQAVRGLRLHIQEVVVQAGMQALAATGRRQQTQTVQRLLAAAAVAAMGITGLPLAAAAVLEHWDRVHLGQGQRP